MIQETANYIMQRMTKYLDNSQMIKLKDTLDESLRQSEDGILEKSSKELMYNGVNVCLPEDKDNERKTCRILSRCWISS